MNVISLSDSQVFLNSALKPDVKHSGLFFSFLNFYIVDIGNCNWLVFCIQQLIRWVGVCYIHVTSFSSIPYYSNLRLISKIDLEV